MKLRNLKPAPTVRRVTQELNRKPLSPSALELILAVIKTSGSRQKPRFAWTVRDEANALTMQAFRHGFLERLHEGKYSPLLDDPTLSRITDAEMKKLMIESSARLAHMLRLKAENPDAYLQELLTWAKYCEVGRWEREAETLPEDESEKPKARNAAAAS